jgi:hypothetical protein
VTIDTSAPPTPFWTGDVSASTGVPFDIGRAMRLSFAGKRVEITVRVVGDAETVPTCGDAFGRWRCEEAVGHEGNHKSGFVCWTQESKVELRETVAGTGGEAA